MSDRSKAKWVMLPAILLLVADVTGVVKSQAFTRLAERAGAWNEAKARQENADAMRPFLENKHPH